MFDRAPHFETAVEKPRESDLQSRIEEYLGVPIEEVHESAYADAAVQVMDKHELHEKMEEIFQKAQELEKIKHTTKHGEYWERVSISGEEYRALDTEVHIWKRAFREKFFSSDSETEIENYVDFLNDSGDQALVRLNALVSNYTWNHGTHPYNYEHYSDRPESLRALENIKNLTGDIAENPDSKYLLATTASMLHERANQGREAWNKKVGLHSEYLPFKISPTRYAISVSYKGSQEIVLSDEDDFEKISALKAELEEIQPELQKVYQYKSELFADFKGEDVSYWPHEVINEMGSTTDVEKRRDKIESDLAKFFKDPSVKDEISYRSGNVDEDKIISLEDVSRNSALDQNTQSKLMADVKFLYTKELREWVKNDLGFDLSALTLPEQFNFLAYVRDKSVSEVAPVKQFISTYGTSGFKTLLSLERGGETLGDEIIKFGQNEEVARQVFEYYGELLHLADIAEVLVKESGYVGDNTSQLASQVRERLTGRAQQDLEKAIQANDSVEVAKKLETYVAKAKVEVALIQEKAKAPLEPARATDIPEETRRNMVAISEKNYEAEPLEFQELIRSGLPEKFSNPNTRFYIDYDKEGNTIFFDAFTDVVDERTGETAYKKFEAVNLSKEFGGAGSVRIAETLNRELESGHTMQAFCDPDNPVSQLYIEHGFVAVGTVSPVGKFSFEIWRSADSSEQLLTKQLSVEELIAQYESPVESVEYKVRKVESGDQFPELSEGKYLTRYFKHNGERYAVFEAAPAALQHTFTPPK
tara:strand:+ start:372 stop:2654 length:2283 start_codon:yes stop_codon:yes gene_type:complete